MKAIIIIAAVIVLAAAFRVYDYVSSSRINSVGDRANSKSRSMAKFDISDEESVKELVNHYKDMID
ncbi:MAG: hypothetical protein KBT05_00235 [Bacteroidales bacterium]|nr:hypothetical protein [Candidatus Cryptobacteroides caccocaballi]